MPPIGCGTGGYMHFWDSLTKTGSIKANQTPQIPKNSPSLWLIQSKAKKSTTVIKT